MTAPTLRETIARAREYLEYVEQAGLSDIADKTTTRFASAVVQLADELATTAALLGDIASEQRALVAAAAPEQQEASQ